MRGAKRNWITLIMLLTVLSVGSATYILLEKRKVHRIVTVFLRVNNPYQRNIIPSLTKMMNQTVVKGHILSTMKLDKKVSYIYTDALNALDLLRVNIGTREDNSEAAEKVAVEVITAFNSFPPIQQSYKQGITRLHELLEFSNLKRKREMSVLGNTLNSLEESLSELYLNQKINSLKNKPLMLSTVQMITSKKTKLLILFLQYLMLLTVLGGTIFFSIKYNYKK